MPISMFALPWRWRERPDRDRVLVFASRFDGRKFRSGRALMGGGMAIRRQALKTPGCLGASLWARPHLGKYYTLSAWRDEDALREFARSDAHRKGVKRVYAAGAVDGALISWWEDGSGWKPRWKDVVRRANAAPNGPYAGPNQSTGQPAA